MTALSSAFVVVALLVPAADKPQDLIVGKWEVKDGELKGLVVEFAKDGVFKVTGKVGESDIKLEGKYKFSADDTVELEMKVKDEVKKDKNKVAIANDILSMTDDKGIKTELKRVK